MHISRKDDSGRHEDARQKLDRFKAWSIRKQYIARTECLGGQKHALRHLQTCLLALPGQVRIYRDTAASARVLHV